MNKQCQCGKGHVSAWDSKCANCRTKREQKQHQYALRVLSHYTIHVVNKHHLKIGEYVGRGSPLGNPYPITEERPRGQAIEAFKPYFKAKVEEGDKRICDELNRLLNILLEKKVLVLVCFCAPKACHAEVIRDTIYKAMYDYVIATGKGFTS